MKLEEDIYTYLKTNTMHVKKSEANRCLNEQYYHYTLNDKDFLYISKDDAIQDNQKVNLEFNIFPEWSVQDVDRMMKELMKKHPYPVKFFVYAISWLIVGVNLYIGLIAIRKVVPAQTSEFDYFVFIYMLMLIVVTLFRDLKARDREKR